MEITIPIQIPRVEIEQIAMEVYERMMPQRSADEEAAKLRERIERIMAKKLITISELQVLLGECSRGYIDKLIDEAHNGKAQHPIPCCNLNGLIMFEPEKVLNWARAMKPLKNKQKRQGGKKRRSTGESN